MQVQSIQFKPRAAAAIADTALQERLTELAFAQRRAAVVAEYGHQAFEELRDAGAAIRQRCVANLDGWIERFESQATRRGATVLFAETGAAVADLVLDICRRHGLTKAIKSKSMLSEEAQLNRALAAAGVQPVETDLGEYICQLFDEPPSHIIAPAFHHSRDEVADLFHRHHGRPRLDEAERLTREAREVLRSHFLSADLGISGGNFLIAETGSLALVTNEGNGRMVTTLPRVHIAITGIEKIVPTLEDLSTLIRLLPRSATGQTISNYFSVVTGPRRAGEHEGPEHLYFILVDNGRTNLLGGELQDMLRCIRCGACMNHCPVYKAVGGHAYGWVYPGPMGSVLTPAYNGLEKALDLPQAATLCGACSVVCPVKIPLPELLRTLREHQVDRHLRPWYEMAAVRLWASAARRPRVYGFLSRWGVNALSRLARPDGMIAKLPLARGWTARRFMPAPKSRQTFRDLYANSMKSRNSNS
jgi:L-lactate dehydrogenase complex protein LldF